uniref:Mediator of RNA polymerase II transcription subunit 21 n=1 Tax=Romanomermis culicivorax TaxID=13658 RepID=A0A915KQK2_ROMCU
MHFMPQDAAGPKWDVVTPEIRPNLNEVNTETKWQWLERIPQDQEQPHQPKKAPEMSNQELVMQLRELKTTIEALFDIIANATIEDDKREADRS